MNDLEKHKNHGSYDLSCDFFSTIVLYTVLQICGI